jgi:yeast amino acid transporter
LYVILSISLISDWREGYFRNIIITGPAGGLVAFWECCYRAVFGYIGLQSLGILAAEAENPRKNIPKAARKVGKRLVFYYVAAALTLSLNVSANDPILEKAFQDPTINPGGPFVLMLRRWGLTGLAHVVNGVGLIAAFGIANVFLYLAVLPMTIDTYRQTRTLYALADAGWAPAIFTRRSSQTRVPIAALLACSLPSTLAFMALKVESNQVPVLRMPF